MCNRELDLLLIGGGITGVGAALDAAARGLSVGLIEQGDLASGTSGKSSKLIHGGLRYLEQLNLSLVREALRERGRLLTTVAPHLVRPVPFLIPLKHHIWSRAYVGTGVALYDRLGGARHLPRGRHLRREGVRTIAPHLRENAYVGGIQFWDAQVDDARFVISVARTAAAYGAQIATGVKAVEILAQGGRASGVRAVDTITGHQYTFRARHVATTIGPWTGSLDPASSSKMMKVRPSKGIHILLPKSAINMETGLLARTESGLLFVIPWEGHWLVGDTDTEWSAEPDLVTAERDDVAVLLERLNSQLRITISKNQILGVFAGLRPLVATAPEADTVNLSREHAISSPMPGMSAISGGKYTTYRLMAEQLIDVVQRDLRHSKPNRASTHKIPLIGADNFGRLWESRHDVCSKRSASR